MILMYSAIVLYDSIQGKVLVGYYLLKNGQAVKKDAALCKMASTKKSCEIQVASQEMDVMVGQWEKFKWQQFR